MENFRSKSTREGRMGMGVDNYYGDRTAAPPTSMHDLRSYSTSHASYAHQAPPPGGAYLDNKEVKMKKSKSRVASTSKNWSFNDPELQRKKRVVSYKAYAVEGKMKGSLRKSFRWIKDTCNHVVHGWW